MPIRSEDFKDLIVRDARRLPDVFGRHPNVLKPREWKREYKKKTVNKAVWVRKFANRSSRTSAYIYAVEEGIVACTYRLIPEGEFKDAAAATCRSRIRSRARKQGMNVHDAL